MSDFKKTARPTTYQGVLFRSKSEACYAKWLTGKGFFWEYEPRRFSVGDYVPDFFIWQAGNEYSAVIEYKPAMVTESYLSEFGSRVLAMRKKARLTAYREEEEGWRIERLNRVVQSIGRTEDVSRLHDHKGDLTVSFRSSEFTCSAEFYKRVMIAWEKENECSSNIDFSHKEENLYEVPQEHLIHCGSFFEDSGTHAFICPPYPYPYCKWIGIKTWLGHVDNFDERREVSQTRFDLRGVK